MRVFVGSLVGVLALWLVFRGESAGALAAAVRGTDLWWTSAALASIGASLALVTLRWQVLFGRPRAGAPRLRSLFEATVVGQAVNITLPIRIGELVRVFLVYRKEGQTLERTVVTVAAERLMDMGVVGLAAVWLALQVALPPWLAGPLRAMTVVGLTVIVLGVVILMAGHRLSAFVRAKLETLAHQGLARFARRSATVVEEASQLRDPRTLGAALGLSIAIFLAAVGTNYLLLLAFHLAVPATAALLVLMVLQVLSAPVSTPGNLGVFQYLTVLALGVYSVDRTTAVAYSLVLYVIAYGPKLALAGWLWIALARDATVWPDVRMMLRGRR